MDKLAQQLSELASKFGPDVFEAAKQAVVIQGYSFIITAVLLLSVGSTLSVFAHWLITRAMHDNNNRVDVIDDGRWFGGGIVGLIGVLLLVIGIGILVNPWTWTAIFHPEVWMARLALRL